ncbi:MAG: hypothetical protein HGA96_00680 [Desulfobulbaceae bacterium]|nr:hypothetical protein [Desulfobulbaceae bacterium]
MECERLIKLIKNWYGQVQGEAMAPARMVDFMRSHLDSCPVCMADPVVDAEVKKIVEIILPAKPPKVVRQEEEAVGDFEAFEEPGEATEDGDEEGTEDGDSDDEDAIEDLDEEDPEDSEDDDF